MPAKPISSPCQITSILDIKAELQDCPSTISFYAIYENGTMIGTCCANHIDRILDVEGRDLKHQFLAWSDS